MNKDVTDSEGIFDEIDKANNDSDDTNKSSEVDTVKIENEKMKEVTINEEKNLPKKSLRR